jgi:hypothetical protein
MTSFVHDLALFLWSVGWLTLKRRWLILRRRWRERLAGEQAGLVTAGAAPEKVLGIGAAPDRMKCRSCFVVNPATGAKTVRPEFRDEINCLLVRDAYHFALGQQLRLPGVYLRKLDLNLQTARLKLLREFYSLSLKLIGK